MSITIKLIGDRGEIVIPKNIRQLAGLSLHTPVEIIPVKRGVLLIPLKKKMKDFAGLFGNKGVKNIKELDSVTEQLIAGNMQ